jgi:Fe-S oxidoreductase
VSVNITLFAIILVIAMAAFLWSCYRRFSLILLGKSEDRFHNIGQRLKSVILFPLAQRCAVNKRYRFGLNHAVLFWCFIILLLANIEFLLHGLAPDKISYSLAPDGVYFTLAFIFDVVSILALLAIILAVIRRLAFAPPNIEARSPDAFVILTLVGLLMIAFFGLHGTEIGLGIERASAYMPVSNLISNIYPSGMSAIALENISRFFWWLHAIVLLGFLNYLPYSKHLHILTSIPNVFFRSLDKVNTQPREEFIKGKTFGVERVDQFKWKALFDSYACTKCGRCSDQCPALSTHKPLDPRHVIGDIKANLLSNGPSMLHKSNGVSQTARPILPLIGGGRDGSIAEEAIWACTTCGACMEICPVFIEHVPRIVDLRRYLVEMQAKVPHELLLLFENIEQRSNPWGIAPGERIKWAADIDVQSFETSKTEYLFYVGCAGAFDTRSRKVTLATAKILNAAGISWGILGKDELCCGDSLRRLGNEYAFEQLAKANVKILKDKGVKKIITQCPHCFNTLKNDYRQYGLEVEVLHHTQVISKSIQNKRIQLRASEAGKVVFHDSCYLGRYNSVYEAPRLSVTKAIGKAPIEMKRNLEGAFCCGGGGGRMWMEEATGERINITRVKEAMSLAPDKICISCPYCLTMFEDGLKSLNAEGKVQVLDVAEIVAGSLEESPARLAVVK